MGKKTDVVAILQKTKEFIEKDENAKNLLTALAKDFSVENNYKGEYEETVFDAICVGFASYALFETIKGQEMAKIHALQELDKDCIFYECKLKDGNNFGLASIKELSEEEIKTMVLEITGEEATGEFRKLTPAETEQMKEKLKKELGGCEDVV